MKKLWIYFLSLFIAINILACSKETVVGPEGKQGIPGVDGQMIHHGDGTPSNNIGKNGDYYIDKLNGNLYGPKDSSGWGNPTVLKGESGSPGQPGSQFLSGTTIPSPNIGKPGDFYFRTNTTELFGPKLADNTWGPAVSLRGHQGQPGNANVFSTGWVKLNNVDWTTNQIDFKLNSDISNPIYGEWKPSIMSKYKTGAVILLYVKTNNGYSHTIPYQTKLGYSTDTESIVNGEVEFRAKFIPNGPDGIRGVNLVLALKEGTWNENLMINIIAKVELEWQMIIIPAEIVAIHKEGLSNIDMNDIRAIQNYFKLID